MADLDPEQAELHLQSEVARDYGVSRVWVQKLMHRFQAEGETAIALAIAKTARQSAGGQH